MHVTTQGFERITKEIPHLESRLLRNLDKNGLWVETDDILVGKLTPLVLITSWVVIAILLGSAALVVCNPQIIPTGG